MQYRKKPVIVEAFRWSVDAAPGWWEGALNDTSTHVGNAREHQGLHGDSPHALIMTLEGVMRVERYDWVILGVKGEIYPCKPDIFELTYEEVL